MFFILQYAKGKSFKKSLNKLTYKLVNKLMKKEIDEYLNTF